MRPFVEEQLKGYVLPLVMAHEGGSAHGERLESKLRAMGFNTIALGRGGKYPNAYVSTYIAAKSAGKPFPVHMPQPPLPGCGGGIAGLRLASGVSVIGMHMAFGGSSLWREQLRSFTAFAETEKKNGNQVILAGDWNETKETIMSQPEFKKLGLVSSAQNDNPTCPTSLPRFMQKQVDHIFIPDAWTVKDFRTVALGSDHLAVMTEADGFA